ncbi:hypothetical protein [Levilinea saccharolytica]|nr:hypothetical protein [Levilinea saccharolytica]GAP16308.1 hypothetical protein LSAC_00157 [Levilinea saccharolytica]
MSMDWIWTAVGFLLTVCVLSYLFGDNPLFRLATSLFVGVAAGYAAVLLIYQVLLPRLVLPLLQGSLAERGLLVIPLVLSVLLLFKLSPRFTRLGNLSMGVIVGVGAGVLVGGTVLGTLLGQTRAAVDAFALQGTASPMVLLFEAVLFLIGTVSTLVYFHFGVKSRPNQPARRPSWMEFTASIGQVFLAVTLGALFAGVFATALAALIDRADFLFRAVQTLF